MKNYDKSIQRILRELEEVNLALNIILNMREDIENMPQAHYIEKSANAIAGLVEALNILREMRDISDENQIRDLRSILICATELELWASDIRGFESKDDIKKNIYGIKRSMGQVIESLENSSI